MQLNAWNRAVIVMVAALLLLPAVGLAQSKVGTSAAPFLTVGIGSRPQAMGGAFVATSDDIHALYWNPAGLARMERTEVMFVHSTWLADMAFDFVGVAFPMGRAGTFGGSATMLSVGEMEVTTERYQEGTGLKFNSYSLCGALSYGYRIYDRFSIGTNVKYIREQIWNETANGFAIDIGTLLITPLKGIRLGTNISNFGTKMQMDGRDLIVFHDPDEQREGNNPNVPAKISTDAWKLPLTMRLGLAGELIQTDQHRITLGVDWVAPNDNTEHYNTGLEYGYREFFFLRGGLRAMRPGHYEGSYKVFQPDNGGGLTFGAGFNIDLSGVIFVTDYAYESYDRLGGVHKYSIGLKF